mgnify:CR=1 FL=1
MHETFGPSPVSTRLLGIRARSGCSDVRSENPVTTKGGKIPARSVVVPGTRTKKTSAGEIHTNCAYIIGQRSASTDRKTSLNETLREFSISV